MPSLPRAPFRGWGHLGGHTSLGIDVRNRQRPERKHAVPPPWDPGNRTRPDPKGFVMGKAYAIP